MTKSVILSNRNFILTLVIGQEDAAQDLSTTLEIQSTKNGPDLRMQDDVIVVINGTPVSIIATGSNHASVVLPQQWPHYEKEGMHLMIRIGEFFDGWHLDTTSIEAP